MTFRFSGFGKSLSLWGNGGLSGGSHGGGSFGGGHSGGLFGGGKGGLFGGFGRDRDCDRDDDHDDDDHDSGDGGGSTGGGSTGGGTTPGTGWPSIPANTAGITFTVDYEGDGVNDNYIPVGRDSDTKTFEDYLAKARDQVATDNPDADPKEVIVKATITTQTGEETSYHFTGLEEDQAADDGQDEDDQDDGDDDSCGGRDDDGHGGDHGRDGDDDHGDEGRSCGDGQARFFTALIGGGRSFDWGHGHDRDDEDDDHHDDDDGFDFC